MTKKKTKQEKNTPTLRFPGFSGEWEEKKLGEITEVKGGKRIPKGHRLQREKNQYPYITVSDMTDSSVSMDNIKYVPKGAVNKIRRYTISVDDIYISVAGTLGLVGTIPKELDGANLTENADKLTQLNCEQKYLLYYLKAGALPHLVKATKTESAQPKLAIYAIKGLKVNLPGRGEQQKIASFLSAVDEWIENLRGQKEKLEQYKKGMMQKIFSQEIRFKDENGKDYPDWEEKRLGEVGKTYNGLTGKTKDDFGTGEPFVTYKQIFDNSQIDIQKFSLVEIGSEENQNKARYGDVFFTTSSETPSEAGFSSVLLDKDVEPYLNSFSFGLRPNSLDEFDPNFARFFFRSPLFRKEVVRLAQGSTRYNISKIAFMKIKILLPTIKEQQKIAEFLTAIDELIELKQKQIDKVEEWKRGLMQWLFI